MKHFFDLLAELLSKNREKVKFKKKSLKNLDKVLNSTNYFLAKIASTCILLLVIVSTIGIGVLIMCKIIVSFGE